MKKAFKVIIIILLILGAIALSALYISTHNIAVLNPKGHIGLRERELMIIVSSLMLIVIIPVFLFTWIFSVKYREKNNKAAYTPDWEHNSLAEFIWWAVPFIIIIILAVITWKSSHELNPFKPLESDKKAINIQVVALDWKWLFIYPDQGIASVNWVQFPENTPVNFEITADAPMNSFWIPQLGGQIYAMPAMRSKLHLIANEQGNFRGASSNISGKGFAGMFFTAKASSEEEFDTWVESVKESSIQLNFDEYLKLVQPSEYNPVAYYVLTQRDLFDRIMMQYDPPKSVNTKQ